ncbi:RtcB family protein [Trichocoleus desertorum AS-A10]
MAKNVASIPFVFKHVALMPDVHLGKGPFLIALLHEKNSLCSLLTSLNN